MPHAVAPPLVLAMTATPSDAGLKLRAQRYLPATPNRRSIRHRSRHQQEEPKPWPAKVASATSRCQSPTVGTAAFYKTPWAGRSLGTRRPAGRGHFSHRRVVNLAILKFKTTSRPGTGKDFVGIHHFGFWVDDVIETGDRVRAAGAK